MQRADPAFCSAMEALEKKHPIASFTADWRTVLALLGSIDLALQHPSHPPHVGARVQAWAISVIQSMGAAVPELAPQLADVFRRIVQYKPTGAVQVPVPPAPRLKRS